MWTRKHTPKLQSDDIMSADIKLKEDPEKKVGPSVVMTLSWLNIGRQTKCQHHMSLLYTMYESDRITITLAIDVLLEIQAILNASMTSF